MERIDREDANGGVGVGVEGTAIGPAAIGGADPCGASGQSLFAARLKRWRAARGHSQLALAGRAGISQRHLSFLESDRARPSRQMVMLLASALQMPLRERNALLVAAGFAATYPERPWDDAAMAPIREALRTTLAHHEPYPALVVDRHWHVVMHNAALGRLLALLGEPDDVWSRVDPTGRRNLMRLFWHPEGLRPLVNDWPGTASALLAKLAAEILANPADAALRALYDELVATGTTSPLDAMPGSMPASTSGPTRESEREPKREPKLDPISDPVPEAPSPPLPVLTLGLRAGDSVLTLFSMICSFGTAVDLTTDELRLELLFPSDPATATFLREVATEVTPNG